MSADQRQDLGLLFNEVLEKIEAAMSTFGP
jgi:hypothetical protein